jgi:predicted O-methyltransferase YrrM
MVEEPKLRYYAEQRCSSTHGTLAEIAQTTFLATVKPFDASDHIQGRLMSLFSKLIQPSLIVEIGTFTGYGTYCLAEGLSADGKVITIEHDPLRIDLIQQNLRTIADRVELINESAKKAITNIDGPIDILFIDAAKREYLNYYETLLPKMRPGGLIIADNILWKGEVARENKSTIAKALDEFNAVVAADDRVEVVVLPYRDGLSLIRVK